MSDDGSDNALACAHHHVGVKAPVHAFPSPGFCFTASLSRLSRLATMEGLRSTHSSQLICGESTCKSPARKAGIF